MNNGEARNIQLHPKCSAKTMQGGGLGTVLFKHGNHTDVIAHGVDEDDVTACVLRSKRKRRKAKTKTRKAKKIKQSGPSEKDFSNWLVTRDGTKYALQAGLTPKGYYENLAKTYGLETTPAAVPAGAPTAIAAPATPVRAVSASRPAGHAVSRTPTTPAARTPMTPIVRPARVRESTNGRLYFSPVTGELPERRPERKRQTSTPTHSSPMKNYTGAMPLEYGQQREYFRRTASPPARTGPFIDPHSPEIRRLNLAISGQPVRDTRGQPIGTPLSARYGPAAMATPGATPAAQHLLRRFGDSLSEEQKGRLSQVGTGKFPAGRGLYEDEIDRMCKKIPGFQACFCADECQNIQIHRDRPTSAILNTDLSSGKGRHWLGLWCNPKEGTLEVYDSFAGHIPPMITHGLKAAVAKAELPHFLQVRLNHHPAQSVTTNDCGFFAMRFILERARGQSFEQATDLGGVTKGEHTIEKMKHALHYM